MGRQHTHIQLVRDNQPVDQPIPSPALHTLIPCPLTLQGGYDVDTPVRAALKILEDMKEIGVLAEMDAANRKSVFRDLFSECVNYEDLWPAVRGTEMIGVLGAD